MSHDDSLDEETKRLLAEVNSDDSSESENHKKPHEKQSYQIKDQDVKWETNTAEDDDSEW